jgi:hypothetical protein
MNRSLVGVALAVGITATIGILPASAAVPASALVVEDGFESGDLSPVSPPGRYATPGYRSVTHSGVQQSIVKNGSWAWRGTNPNGVPSYTYRRLPGSYNELWAGAWVYIASHSSTVKLFALRPLAQRSIDVYVDQRSRVSVRNNIGATTTYGATTMASGGWHRVVLHARIGNGNGSFDVSVDGVAVPGLSRTGQNVGTLPFGELRLGDIAVAATFDLVLDDVVVSTAAP